MQALAGIVGMVIILDGTIGAGITGMGIIGVGITGMAMVLDILTTTTLPTTLAEEVPILIR
jgi:hypothetical protein